MAKRYTYFVLFVAFLLTACGNNKEKTPVVSTDATISKLTFMANDSFPNLHKTTFVIENLADTGRIYNPDSLDYGTCLDTVKCYFSYTASSVGAATVYTAHDTVSITGMNQINFADKPVRVLVTANDLKTSKWYNIDVRVHQSDPDLYQWKELTPSIADDAEGEQKAFFVNQTFYFIVNDGLQNRLYYSQDATVWMPKGKISGLPADCYVRQMVSHNNTLFYADGKDMYALDPSNLQVVQQTITPDNYQLSALLFSFNDSLWSVMQDTTTKTLQLATSADGFTWHIKSELALGNDFPVRDFATDTFTIMSGRPCAIILGGWDTDGNFNNTQYNVEYSPDGYRVTYFQHRTTLPLIGASIVQYGKNKNHFILFSGMLSDVNLALYNMYETTNQGYTWAPITTSKNCLPTSYGRRAYVTALRDDKNNIYVFGGQSLVTRYSNVYKGYLNSINW